MQYAGSQEYYDTPCYGGGGGGRYASDLMPMDKPRDYAPQHFGADKVDPKGFLGAYVPADTYLRGGGCHAFGRSYSSRPLQAACSNEVQAMGPCAAGFGLDTDQLFPTSLDACDGFDQVLVSAPLDFLYADNLMDDVNVLTTTRLQTHDLRGEPAVAAMFSSDEHGHVEMGPFGGMYQASVGPYEFRKPVRTYIV